MPDHQGGVDHYPPAATEPAVAEVVVLGVREGFVEPSHGEGGGAAPGHVRRVQDEAGRPARDHLRAAVLPDRRNVLVGSPEHPPREEVLGRVRYQKRPEAHPVGGHGAVVVGPQDDVVAASPEAGVAGGAHPPPRRAHSPGPEGLVPCDHVRDLGGPALVHHDDLASPGPARREGLEERGQQLRSPDRRDDHRRLDDLRSGGRPRGQAPPPPAVIDRPGSGAATVSSAGSPVRLHARYARRPSRRPRQAGPILAAIAAAR